MEQNLFCGVWNENPELPHHPERGSFSKTAQVRNHALKSRISYFPEQRKGDHDISVLPSAPCQSESLTLALGPL